MCTYSSLYCVWVAFCFKHILCYIVCGFLCVCVNYKSGSPGPRKGPQSTQESSEEH